MLQSLVLKIIVTRLLIKFVGILLCSLINIIIIIIIIIILKNMMNRYGIVSPR